MEIYIEFRKFPTIEEALEIAGMMDKRNISYQIVDSTPRYGLVTNSTFDINPVLIKVKAEDLDEANRLFAENVDADDDSHYLYSFSDDDLKEVIASPDDWTTREQAIAGRIIQQRGITITADEIRGARLKVQKEKEQIITENKPVNKTYSWFLTIAILSMFNTILISLTSTVRFIFGLAFTQIIDEVLFNSYGEMKLPGILVSFLISGIYIFIWYHAKAQKDWAYILGMALYVFDLLFYLAYKDWLSSAFHLVALAIILAGYVRLTSAKKKDQAAETA